MAGRIVSQLSPLVSPIANYYLPLIAYGSCTTCRSLTFSSTFCFLFFSLFLLSLLFSVSLDSVRRLLFEVIGSSLRRFVCRILGFVPFLRCRFYLEDFDRPIRHTDITRSTFLLITFTIYFERFKAFDPSDYFVDRRSFSNETYSVSMRISYSDSTWSSMIFHDLHGSMYIVSKLTIYILGRKLKK